MQKRFHLSHPLWLCITIFGCHRHSTRVCIFVLQKVACGLNLCCGFRLSDTRIKRAKTQYEKRWFCNLWPNKFGHQSGLHAMVWQGGGGMGELITYAGGHTGMRGVCLVFHVLFNYKCRKLANKQRDGKGGGGTDWASFGCSHEFWADLGNWLNDENIFIVFKFSNLPSKYLNGY